MADDISNLPTDNSVPNQDELQIMNSIFKENTTTFNKIASGLKEVLILCVLLYILLSPQVTNLFLKFFPSTESVYIRNLIVCLLFFVMYIIVDNIHLVKKP